MSCGAFRDRENPGVAETRSSAVSQPLLGRDCRLRREPAALRLIAHRPQIVLGVLKMIFRCDQIPPQRFGASQLQVALVIPLRILRLPREAGPDDFAFP